MKTLQLRQHCADCPEDIVCEVCSAPLCSDCALPMSGKQVCRACSCAVRHDYGLIDRFMQWHAENPLEGVKVTNGPMQRDMDDGKFGAHIEFETDELVGFVSIFSNGQCDVNAMSVTNGQSQLNSFIVCHDVAEMDEFLEEVYRVVRA